MDSLLYTAKLRLLHFTK